MTKLYLIRHGEADHNVGAKLYGDEAYDMPEFWNPSLTEKGIMQAKQLQTLIDLHDKHIIVSPLQRALETAYNGFPGATFRIDDQVSEFNPAWRCNRRIDTVTLQDEWPGHIINCSKITPFAEESYEDLLTRTNNFIKNMRVFGEDVVVISHHDFIRALFDNIEYKCSKIHHCQPYIIEL
jgi:broad specificity phosphatase PhoE